MIDRTKDGFSGWSDQAKKWLGDDFWDDVMGIVTKAGPRADIYTTEGVILVIIELPGIRDISEIQLHVDSTSITVKGKTEKKYPDVQVVQNEIFFGNFERTIQLPAPIRPDKVNAQFQRGLLEVKLFRQGTGQRQKQRVRIESLD
ncbi:MAG: Hsp20/alpha crystallin family protein [Bacilli bacterium]